MAEKSKFIRRQKARTVVRDIANLKGISRTDAVLQYVDEKRIQSKVDHGDDKTNIPLQDMPWQPEPRNWMRFPVGSISVLKMADHRRYVAIISNFLRSKLNFRFELNRLELEGLDERLKPERDNFEEVVHSHIANAKHSLFHLNMKGSIGLFVKRETMKLQDAFGDLAFRDELMRIAWPHDLDEEIPSGTYYLKRLRTLIDGRQCRVRIPDVRRCCRYFMNTHVVSDFLNAEEASKTNIVNDSSALDLALSNGLEYVMDASALRQLIVDAWMFRNQVFHYRVSVVRRVYNGKTHRVVFLSKPLLASPMDVLHIHRQFMKWVVKAEIRRSIDGKFHKDVHSKTSSHERQIFQKEKSVEKDIDKAGESFVEVGKTGDLLSGILDNIRNFQHTTDVIAAKTEKDTQASSLSKQLSESKNKNAKEADAKKKFPSIGGTNDLLDGIMSSMGCFPQNSSDNSGRNEKVDLNHSVPSVNSSFSTSQLFNVSNETSSTSQSHGYRYSMISLSVDGKHSLLVRSSNHGVDQEGKPISLTVKNEYVPEAGAQKKCDEELLWNCVTATLKDATEHINLHMFPRNGHCVQMQRFEPVRHYSEMSMELKQKFWTRIKRICTLIEALERLDIGEYLLVKDGDSLKILNEVLPEEKGYIADNDADMMTNESTNDIDVDNIDSINDNTSINDSDLNNAIKFDDNSNVKDDAHYNSVPPPPTVYDLRTALAMCCFKQMPRFSAGDNNDCWTGIDTHLPLMWHIIRGRIPGSFFPLDYKANQNANKNNKSANKRDQSADKFNQNASDQNSIINASPAPSQQNSDQRLTKSQLRRLRRGNLQARLNNSFHSEKGRNNTSATSSLSSSSESLASTFALNRGNSNGIQAANKPAIKRHAESSDCFDDKNDGADTPPAAKVIRRFKRPGEKPTQRKEP